MVYSSTPNKEKQFYFYEGQNFSCPHFEDVRITKVGYFLSKRNGSSLFEVYVSRRPFVDLLLCCA